jgi:large subunit ribosomal protein L22
VDALVVGNVMVNDGPSWKRIMPRAMGRAYRIHKRTSHITVIVKEK